MRDYAAHKINHCSRIFLYIFIKKIFVCILIRCHNIILLNADIPFIALSQSSIIYGTNFFCCSSFIYHNNHSLFCPMPSKRTNQNLDFQIFLQGLYFLVAILPRQRIVYYLTISTYFFDKIYTSTGFFLTQQNDPFFNTGPCRVTSKVNVYDF